MVFGRRQKSLVGLDIGSSAVKVAEVRRQGDGVRLVRQGWEPLPYESVVDGSITDPSVVSDAIRRLFARETIKTKEVAVALSGPAVIVKKVALPRMPTDELRETIKWESTQHIPFDPHDVKLDYHVMEGPAGEHDVEVLLVAAKKDRVLEYTSVVSSAGCVPVVLDVDAFALLNAYEVNYGVQTDRVEVLVNVGASVINLNVVEGRRSVFTRDVAIGGNAYSEAIQRELNLEFEEAEKLKQGTAVNGVTYDDAQPVIRAVTQTVLQEVSKTLDFFRATAATDRFDGIVLSGGASRAEGLGEALAERFLTDVREFDPLRRVEVDPQLLLGADERPDLTTVLPVALGLALRHVDDR